MTDLRMGTCIYSAEGQLARGITGGRTDRSKLGRMPDMLGVRALLLLLFCRDGGAKCSDESLVIVTSGCI